MLRRKEDLNKELDDLLMSSHIVCDNCYGDRFQLYGGVRGKYVKRLYVVCVNCGLVYKLTFLKLFKKVFMLKQKVPGVYELERWERNE